MKPWVTSTTKNDYSLSYKHKRFPHPIHAIAGNTTCMRHRPFDLNRSSHFVRVSLSVNKSVNSCEGSWQWGSFLHHEYDFKKPDIYQPTLFMFDVFVRVVLFLYSSNIHTFSNNITFGHWSQNVNCWTLRHILSVFEDCTVVQRFEFWHQNLMI